MSTFVLLHGAFHGGWCWARVTPLLQAAGHRVFTVTQTGLGERAHLIHAGITLDVFVQDVVGLLEAEELADVVLVGHSFGGNVISGAAELVPERIRRLVYLDAAVPQSGRTPLDSGDPGIAAARRKLASETGGVGVAAPEPGVFGVPEGEAADWLRRRMTPQPFGAMNSALTLRAAPGNGLPSTYVFCMAPVYEPLEWAREVARGLVRDRAEWSWRDLAAGHDAMVTAPQETAALLMELAV